MHRNILDPEQEKILDFLPFAKKKGFYLVGGTAIALHTSRSFDACCHESLCDWTQSKVEGLCGYIFYHS
jgi:hypothetical protein